MSAITFAIGIIYGKVSLTYFCADDDFIEIHRIAFEDIYDPSRVFTTSHFNSYKYRPLNSAISLLTYWIGDGKPIFFRVRNVMFHLINVILLYNLSYLLFSNIYISSMTAALFGLHPLTNQVVNGSIWTTVIAHTEFLAALVVFISSLRVQRFWWQLLITSLVIGWLGLLTYDSEIVIFGIMLLYLAVYFMTHREHPVRWKFVALFFVLSTILIFSYFILRILFVPYGWRQSIDSLSMVSVIVKNIGMYTFALLLPVDSVLANEWLHTPLPSKIEPNMSIIIVMITLAFGIASIAVFVIQPWRKTKIFVIRTINWTTILFLMFGIMLTLLPVLLLSSHPSESYLYLPVAFYALLLSCTLATLLYGALTLKGRASVITVSVALLGLSCAATWTRNESIIQCGETAHRILYSLPGEQLTNSAWILSFANIAGEEISHPYGLYGLRGINTIGAGKRVNSAITSALQFVYKNNLLTGEIVRPEELRAKCSSGLSSRHLCLWVHWDGQLEELR